MSEENDLKLTLDEKDSGYETSPEKAEKEEFRNFVEEPGDDDGENRHPTEHTTMLYTALLVMKGMIGEGILNLPLIIKTFGIIGGSVMTCILCFIAVSVASYLGKCKEITQRYSYAIYSKLMMGTAGTIIMKTSIIVMVSTMAVVQLIVFGDVLKGLLILVYDINTINCFGPSSFYVPKRYFRNSTYSLFRNHRLRCFFSMPNNIIHK